MATKKRKPAKSKTPKRTKKVGASCSTSTFKSSARAEGAAAMARKLGKKVTVDGKKVIVCP